MANLGGGQHGQASACRHLGNCRQRSEWQSRVEGDVMRKAVMVWAETSFLPDVRNR